MTYLVICIFILIVCGLVWSLTKEAANNVKEHKEKHKSFAEQLRDKAKQNKKRLEQKTIQQQEQILKDKKYRADDFIEEVLLPKVEEAVSRGEFKVTVSRGGIHNTFPPLPESSLRYREWADILEHYNANDCLRKYIEDKMEDMGFSCEYIGYSGGGLTINGFKVSWK